MTHETNDDDRWLVEWRIDGFGKTPLEAAHHAFKTFRAPKAEGRGDAVVFHVTDQHGHETIIDLDEDGWPETDPTEKVEVPREVLRILAEAAHARLEDLTTGVEDGIYERAQNEGEIGDIERALRYVPDAEEPPASEAPSPGDEMLGIVGHEAQIGAPAWLRSMARRWARARSRTLRRRRSGSRTA